MPRKKRPNGRINDVDRFSNKRCYYVYRHLKGTDGCGDVFYIGRGKHTKGATCDSKLYSRAFDKNKRTKYWKRIFNKHGRCVEIMMDNLTYEESVRKEIEFITLYGSTKKGGTLCNLTDGGEGSVNFKHSPETIQKLKGRATPAGERVKSHIKYLDSGCWQWIGPVSSGTGHPRIWGDGRNINPKRYLYEQEKNVKLERNQHVYNSCHNQLCVNPDHLEIHIAARAIREKSSLTEQDVKEIKKMAYEGITHHELSKRYNVARVLITKITTGQNWGWVEVEGIDTTFKSTYHKKKKKQIYCVETGITYPSAREACLDVFGSDEHFRSLRKACRVNISGKYRGYNFKFV